MKRATIVIGKSDLCKVKLKFSKYAYLGLAIMALLVLGFGLIVLSPQSICIILSLGYITFLTLSKTTDLFEKDLFVIRYEKIVLSIILLTVVIIQLTIKDAVRSLPIILMFIIFILITYLVFQWIFEKYQTIRELKNANVASELLLLKSQVNPHFFFNTLNNLYGLAIEKSDATPGMILKLSEMMRYTIYDGKKEFVSLSSEITFLKNYIDLHEIRHFNKLQLDFHSDVEDNSAPIAPLLLINILENAFKHGAEKLEKDAFIKVHLETKGDLFSFVIENNFPEDENAEVGIGLQNLRRRLELLYPNAHKLTTTSIQDLYRAELTINLDR